MATPNQILETLAANPLLADAVAEGALIHTRGGRSYATRWHRVVGAWRVWELVENATKYTVDIKNNVCTCGVQRCVHQLLVKYGSDK